MRRPIGTENAASYLEAAGRMSEASSGQREWQLRNVSPKGPAMSHTSHYQTLVNRGRKAGLNTRDLYSAIASLPVAGSVGAPGQADGNGYVSSLTEQGTRIYRPADGCARP